MRVGPGGHLRFEIVEQRLLVVARRQGRLAGSSARSLVPRLRYLGLQRCDAVLIYVDQAGPAWLQAMLDEIKQAPGYGRGAPFKVTGIVLAGEEDRYKSRYRTREVDLVMKSFDDFNPDSVRVFVEGLT